jgi:hypothetical protein
MSRRRLTWIAIYAMAMAYLESAVVVYLRAIYYPDGFSFPIKLIPDSMAAIEVGREAATIVMLAAMAMAVGSGRWQRFLIFCVGFGVWDIFYYIWLKVFLDWPPSLLTWDILFLIPIPWMGPVLAPVMVSVAVILGALWLMRLEEAGHELSFGVVPWSLALLGGVLVLLSFMIDFKVALTGEMPPPFRWWLFAAGMVVAISGLLVGVRALPSRQQRLPAR